MYKVYYAVKMWNSFYKFKCVKVRYVKMKLAIVVSKVPAKPLTPAQKYVSNDKLEKHIIRKR